ncbi:hypothetical protein F383_04034 [Gossypium arboreum]|uniref:Uncharacterized protein n=1 Tax=Gossypium arboreum TaxID=29729 RepID=A0A0B0PVD6_GOSAR|nr:hypothetical protein F383_04034 [Gossypium arboreum]
MTSSPYILEAH